jgi:CRISPR-associated endonuclease Csn1
LRKKALTQKIEKEELAWLLLHFNQKRGYYQLRGEEDEDATRTAQTRTYFLTQEIESINDTQQLYKGLKVIQIKLSNGEIGKYFNKEIPKWIGLKKNIIVTIDTDKDGNDKLDKDGNVSKRFSIPTDEDWEKKWKLIKIKTEKEIKDSNKSVGSYIYDTLLQNPNQKIKGKLVRVIERKFYKDELKTILETQKKFHTELQDATLYNACLEELYEHNDAHRNNNQQKDFTHLFLNDIIFYQRPLKSKSSLISNCKYEARFYKDKEGNIKSEPIKCIAKSHPIFQEFRLLQWMKNLKIFIKETDEEVTSHFLKTEEDWANLFDWLNEKKEISQDQFLKYSAFNLKKDWNKYRWNFVDDKSYPCNETRTQITSRLSKVENVPENFLTKETEEKLWHILYSVEDKDEIKAALKTFASKHSLGDDFVENFKKFPPYKKEYGSYSAKAIKKLLALMRFGNNWNEVNINNKIKERINKIIDAEYDEKIKDRVREKAINLNKLEHFQGLPLWLASYIIYNRHSEDGESKKWNIASEIEFLQQHSLRNPIVEQVINETLRVVKDIWNTYGNGEENFFDEIHIELGREMKNPASDRKRMTEQNTRSENTNLRIKAMLSEFLNDSTIENVRPYSPSQQDILKIYEDGILASYNEKDIDEDILKISKSSQPTKSEISRYKLWLEQKYCSPYTGEIIPLNKLFTPAYEIEHIIPQSRYFDDSFSNKVICEAEVNKEKDNQLGLEFIKNHHGQKITLNYGKTVQIFDELQYEDFVKKQYANNRSKLKKLLLEEIPESFIQRQMNDTRYISKVVKNLLSNIVREKDEQETTSKNLLSSNGNITSTLKQDWGLNDVWNDIITPRFERLNELTKSNNFGEINKNTNKFLPQVPLELQKGFNKKRIDHRHHAVDALVIACATRNHINYLNNQNALEKNKKQNDKEKLKNRFDLKSKLCFKKFNDENKDNYKWIFHKPWQTFTQETKEQLFTTIVSFKQNVRVINKTINHYQHWKEEDGKQKKVLIKQDKGDSWAIRKPMHKETVSGQVNLRLNKTVNLSVALDNWKMIINKNLKSHIKELVKNKYDTKMLQKYFKDRKNTWNNIDVSKVEIYYFDNNFVASRVKLDDSFTLSKIETITDTGIQKILTNHLENHKGKLDTNGKVIAPETLAFSPDGIDELNKNITALNNGKFHQPIFKVRTYEAKGNKFNVGIKGNKKDKFVEAAKGTNLFFAIYYDEENKKRNYETIPLNIVIERQKQGLSSVPEKNEKQHNLVFGLSPNDLVYVPTKEEFEDASLVNFDNLNKVQINRIYKAVSFTGNRLYAVPNNVATSIVDKTEFTQLNKLESSIYKISIKEFCWKLEVNRLGKITKVV